MVTRKCQLVDFAVVIGVFDEFAMRHTRIVTDG